jgi:hypothetical protein
MDDDAMSYDLLDGLWTATLQDAGEVDIVLNRSGSPELLGCTIVRVDRDALLVTARTRPKHGPHEPDAAMYETLLIPTHAISHITLRASTVTAPLADERIVER